MESQIPLSILDINFYVVKTLNNKVKLITNVYTKPIGAYQYLHWESSHPVTAKIAIPIGEYVRRSRILNNSYDITETREDLTKKLRKRGYPALVLTYAFDRAQNIIDTSKLPNRSQIPRLLKKIEDKRRSLRFPWSADLISKYQDKEKTEIIWPIVLNYNSDYT